jgi:hypothetical protein
MSERWFMENPPSAKSEAFGALVGWTGESLGERVILKMESIRSAHPRSDDAVQDFRYVLTRSQAAVLANYLYEISGQTPARKHRRGWLARLLER